jgi:hypothetical protein
MRRGILLAIVILVGAVATTAVAATRTTTLEASFQVFYGKSAAHPCDAFFCGAGTVQGYGPATFTFNLLTFSGFDESGCGTLTAEEIITLDDGSGSLRLAESGTVCGASPGSTFAPGAEHSFGNPYSLDLTYTVKGGTGIFANAKGTGSVTIRTAGESGHKTVSGTLVLRR